MKKVLITGATGGFGVEFSKYYASKNYELFLHGTQLSKLNRLQQTLQVKATLLPADFSNREELNQFIDQIEEIEFDIVINNAGFGDHRLFTNSNRKKIEAMVETNVLAFTLVAFVTMKKMRERKKGAILNVGSVASYFPGPYMAQYYATKAYVLSLSEALYIEGKGDNIIVTCLCPGPTKTEFHVRANVSKTSVLSKLFINDVDQVIDKAVLGLKRRRRVVYPNFQSKMMVYSSHFIPRGVFIRIMHFIQQTRLLK